jgi:hypothetical protein
MHQVLVGRTPGVFELLLQGHDMGLESGYLLVVGLACPSGHIPLQPLYPRRHLLVGLGQGLVDLPHLAQLDIQQFRPRCLLVDPRLQLRV